MATTITYYNLRVGPRLYLKRFPETCVVYYPDTVIIDWDSRSYELTKKRALTYKGKLLPMHNGDPKKFLVESIEIVSFAFKL